MLSICTFKWGSKYSVEHVLKLGRMLRRNLTIPFEYVLITDGDPDTAGLPGAPDRVLPLWTEKADAKLCGVRLHAFHPDMRDLIGPRFAWVDLDVVITGNVDHIFGRTESFVALATPQGPLWYNGSLIMMDAGAFPEVDSTWTPEAYAALPARYAAEGMQHGGQSDEGWMTAVLGPGKATVGPAEGVRYFKHIKHETKLPKGTCMVVMNGRRFDPSMKSWQHQCPWIVQHWR